MAKQKLELTWIGKDVRPKLEPRILLEDPSKSYHAKHRVSENDIFDNRLIFGDNLLALKALEQEFSGKVKCIYIDPPYNTGNAFEHYDDGLEHSIWLSLMQSRLEVLWRLLTNDGFLAVQIDDNEFAKLYLLLAEICGESNLKVICVKMSEPTGVKMASINKVGGVAKLKEYVVLAGKSGIKNLTLEKIPKEKWDTEYKTLILNVSEDELKFIKDALNSEMPATAEELDKIYETGKKATFTSVSEYSKKVGIKITEEWLFSNAWRIVQFATLTGGALQLAIEKKRSYGENLPSFFPLITKTGVLYCIKGQFNEQTSLPRSKLLFADEYLQVHAGDFWNDIKTTGLDNEGNVDFKNGKKPEKLIKRIIGACTRQGDLVLDSFAGSGTTGAVAHKMGRRWIMVELGEHCHTHIIPRLQKVIDGVDQGGISQAVNWQGGGGFRYYSLAPSLLKQDAYGQWVINKEYNPEMLAEAICKLEGFSYAPSADHYWQHGCSTEDDFIYVTTQMLTSEQLQALSDEVGQSRTLLVCCAAFRGDVARYPNLTVKKLPKMVLSKCEWGHDDYSLNVENLPQAPKEKISTATPSTGSVRTMDANQVGLFGEDEGSTA